MTSKTKSAIRKALLGMMLSLLMIVFMGVNYWLTHTADFLLGMGFFIIVLIYFIVIILANIKR